MSATKRAWTIVGLVAAVLVLFGSRAGAACWAARENRDGAVTFHIERGGSGYGEFRFPGGSSDDGRSGPLPGLPGDESRSGSDDYGDRSGDQGSQGGSQDGPRGGKQGGQRGQRGDRSDGGTSSPGPEASGSSAS